MSRLKVRLVAGEDYEGELPNDVTLYIHNTVTEATIDLAVGIPHETSMHPPVPSLPAMKATIPMGPFSFRNGCSTVFRCWKWLPKGCLT